MIKYLNILLSVAALSLPSLASADRIIVDPSAYSLTSGFDAQVYQSVQYKPHSISLLDIGTPELEIEGAYLTKPGLDRLAVSGQSLIFPETFATPALSVGVRDLGNSAGAYDADGFYGRGYYLVLTKSLDNNLNPPKIHGVTFTAGLGAGSFRGLFGGLTSSLPFRLFGTAEYDSRRMNYSVFVPVGKVSRLSFDRIGNQDWVGLELHTPVSM